MRCSYANNPFCSKLKAENRRILCDSCQTFPFTKKMVEREHCPEIAQELGTAKQFFCTMIVEGAMCTSNGDALSQAFLLWQPGDMMNPEAIMEEAEPLRRLWHYRYLTDGAYAIFDGAVLKDLFFHSTDFAAALFSSVAQTRLRQTNFLLGTRLQDARAAIRYILLFCRENNFPALTHEQIAYLCGLDRATVTRMLKKILQEPTLDIALLDYVRLIYNGEQI